MTIDLSKNKRVCRDMKKHFQEGIIQLAVIMVISWLCIYFIPNDLFFTKYLPSSFSGLYWLILLTMVVATLVFIWIPLLHFILSPVYAKSHAAGIPFDLATLTVLYTLHIIPILALVHNSFWARIPFQPTGPPIGPEEVIMMDDKNPDSSTNGNAKDISS